MNKQIINYHEEQYLYPNKLTKEEWLELGKLPNLLYDAVRDPNTSICFIHNLLTIGKANIYDVSTFYYLTDLYFQKKNKSKVIKDCYTVIEKYINESFAPSIYKIDDNDIPFKNENKTINNLFKSNVKETIVESVLNNETFIRFINTHQKLVLESYKIYDYKNQVNNINNGIKGIIDGIKDAKESIEVLKRTNSEIDINYNTDTDNIGINLIILLSKFGIQDLTDYIYRLIASPFDNIFKSIKYPNYHFAMFFNCIIASNNINLINHYISVFNKSDTNFVKISLPYSKYLYFKYLNTKSGKILMVNLDLDSIYFIMSLSQLYSIRFMQIITNYNNMLKNVQFNLIIPFNEDNTASYGDINEDNINYCNTYDNLISNYFPKNKNNTDLINHSVQIKEKYDLNFNINRIIWIPR